MKIETLKDGNNGVHYPSVQLDIHIAKELYIELSQIRDTVKNNKDSFQEYDCFQLTDDEFNELKTLDESREHPIFYPSIFANYNSNFNPLAFTENGLNKLLEILKLNDRTPVIHGSSQQLFYIYRYKATNKEYVLYEEIKKLDFVHPSEYSGMSVDGFDEADKRKDLPSLKEFLMQLEFDELPRHFQNDKMVFSLMEEIKNEILYKHKEIEDRENYFTRLILAIAKGYNYLIKSLKSTGKNFQNTAIYNQEAVKEIAHIGRGVDVDDKAAESVIKNILGNFEKEQSEILWNLFLLYEFIEELQKFTDSKKIGINLVKISKSQHVEHIFAGILVDKESPKITIPPNVLKWLQESICVDDKPFIEDAKAKPLNWLQNKQLARILLTHENIRGNLGINEAARQAPSIFIKDGKTLYLANNDERQESKNGDRLKTFLNGLKKHDPLNS